MRAQPMDRDPTYLAYRLTFTLDALSQIAAGAQQTGRTADLSMEGLAMLFDLLCSEARRLHDTLPPTRTVE